MNKSIFMALFLMSAFAGLSASDVFDVPPRCAKEKEELERRIKEAQKGCASFYKCYYAGINTIYTNDGIRILPRGNQYCKSSTCDIYGEASFAARKKLEQCEAKK